MSLGQGNAQEIGSSVNSADNDDGSSSDEQRAGRFYGPDSSWRYYTQNERSLAASLQQTENNDLGKALYDVHAMKAGARGLESISTAKPWHSKRRWIQSDRVGNMPFQPSSKWTAWPMKSDFVPRTREEWGISAADPVEHAATYSKPEPWKPSLRLEQELKASFLRQAKNRFNHRQWESDITQDCQMRSISCEIPSYPDYGSSQELTTSMLHDDVDLQPGDVSTPVFLADDDVASTILQPTVRHIISRQDNLLAALHQSRRGHGMDHSFTTRAKRRGPSRKASPIRSEASAKVARKRKRDVSDAAQPNSDTPTEHDGAETRFKTARKVRNRYRKVLGLRDWSEVLGIAALLGWEQPVIDRAARRCAALFGEKMSMRLMVQGSRDSLQDRIVDYLPGMVSPVSVSVDTSTESPIEENSNACPHKTCKRHLEPYEKRWRLREHLKKAHNYSIKDLEDWKLQTDKHGHRTALKALSAPGDEAEEEELETSADGDEDDGGNGLDGTGSQGSEDWIQPITVRIGRSRDKRARASASRSRSKQAAAKRTAEEDLLGSGSAMLSNSEL